MAGVANLLTPSLVSKSLGTARIHPGDRHGHHTWAKEDELEGFTGATTTKMQEFNLPKWSTSDKDTYESIHESDSGATRC